MHYAHSALYASSPAHTGYCHGCCHPVNNCCCDPRSCRKESKELLLLDVPGRKDDGAGNVVVGGIAGSGIVAGRPLGAGAKPESAVAYDTLKGDVARDQLADLRDAAMAALGQTEDVSGELSPHLSETRKADLARGGRLLALNARANVALARGVAMIGGSCCAHLSAEYVLLNPAAAGGIVVALRDADNTIMIWARPVAAGSGYTIKEDIITTYPGALLVALAVNVTGRLRWCEVFSC